MLISHGKTARGTIEAGSLDQPYTVPTVVGRPGALVGLEVLHNVPVAVDMYGGMNAGETHSTQYLLTGQLNSGKSALSKSLTRRMSLWKGVEPDGRPCEFRTQTFDRKMGEYTKATESLGSEIITLSGGYEGIRFNPFDPVLNMGEVHTVDIAANYAQHAKGEPLDIDEKTAVQVAAYKMLKSPHKPSAELFERMCLTLELSDRDEYYKSNSIVLDAASELSVIDTMAKRMASYQLQAQEQDSRSFLLAARRVGRYYGEILRGSYGGVIGGDGSMIDALSQRMTTIVVGSANLGAQDLVYGTLLRWRTIARHSKNPDLMRIIPHLMVSDEEHKAMVSPWHITAKSEEMRDARATMTAGITITQYERDLGAAGGLNESLRAMAKGIEEAVAARIMFRIPNNPESIERVMRIGLSEEYAWRLTQLPDGYAMFKQPNKSAAIIRVVLTDSDLSITYSNQANDTVVDSRKSAFEDPHFRARALAVGMKIPDEYLYPADKEDAK